MCLLSNDDTNDDEEDEDMVSYGGDDRFSRNSIEYSSIICSIT